MSTYGRPENACRDQELSAPQGELFGDVREFEYMVLLHRSESLRFFLRMEYEGTLLDFVIEDDMIDSHGRCHEVRRLESQTLYGLDLEDDRVPDGEVGAGPLLVWDRGTYSPRVFGNLSSSMAVWQGIRRGELQIEFHGERLSGMWTLQGKDPNWRLKPSDRAAGIWDDESSLQGWTLDELDRMYQLFK